MSPKARRYSRWGGIAAGIITFVVFALFMAVLSLPGMGHYSGDSASDLWFYIGLSALWALVIALIAGAAGWFIGGTMGTLADRQPRPTDALGEGTPDVVAERGVKVTSERSPI